MRSSKPFFRKVMIVNIPIKSDSLSDFKASYYSEHTANIINFIKETLYGNFKIKINEKFDFDFSEIIQNSYDSYAEAGLVPGNEFILKIVIKEKDQKIIVNFMDNGSGFDNNLKQIYFKRTDFKYKNKNHDLFGGIGLGLAYLEIDVTKNNASLFFKNRKQGGATVSIQFTDSTKEVSKTNSC